MEKVYDINHPRCKDCKFWKEFRNYGFGSCEDRMPEISVYGDGIVDEVETFEYQYCSNYEPRS